MANMKLSSFLRSAFDGMVEGVLFIDTKGIVTYANKAYLNFIHVEEKDLLGHRLRDFRPHAQLPVVVESGHQVLHAQRLEGLEEAYFVNMYPVYENGVVTGGLSVITFMDEAQRARVELENYEKQNKELLKQVNQRGNEYTFDSIIAVAPDSIATKMYARKLADGDMTVLLEAESGTGKEVYAQAIHNASARKNGVFVAVNCAGFTEEMLESELFGYVAGAFTGAQKGGKIGLFEAARGGTLFLDEIAEMDVALQAKLLRALQEHKIRPVGSVSEYDIDVRVICACNADLKKCVENGTFRKDLYYRISSFPVHLAPLRERKEDIPPLVSRILDQMAERTRRKITVSPDAMACLMGYSWPGNVRELRNVVEFAAYMAPTDEIRVVTLPDQLREFVPMESSEHTPDLAERVRLFEQEEIGRLIAHYGNTVEGKKKVAKILNISLATLYNKMNKF